MLQPSTRTQIAYNPEDYSKKWQTLEEEPEELNTDEDSPKSNRVFNRVANKKRETLKVALNQAQDFILTEG